METYWKIIINTDAYAGNFVDKLCQYVTGMDNGNREEEPIEDIPKEIEEIFEDVAHYQYTEYETKCVIIYDDNDKYDSIAFLLNKEPDDDLIRIIKDRSQDFFNTYEKVYPRTENAHVKILGFKLIEVTVTEKELPLRE